MNVFIIVICMAAVAAVIMYFSAKNAHEIKEEEPRFQPRKVTYTKGVDPYETEKPKKKYYKKRNKKKKPAVAESAPTEKRPVGRPRKAE
jgi:flagellar basal body-associated protein FliL